AQSPARSWPGCHTRPRSQAARQTETLARKVRQNLDPFSSPFRSFETDRSLQWQKNFPWLTKAVLNPRPEMIHHGLHVVAILVKVAQHDGSLDAGDHPNCSRAWIARGEFA